MILGVVASSISKTAAVEYSYEFDGTTNSWMVGTFDLRGITGVGTVTSFSMLSEFSTTNGTTTTHYIISGTGSGTPYWRYKTLELDFNFEDQTNAGITNIKRTNAQAGITMNDGRRHMAVVTYDASTYEIILYIDGSEAFTEASDQFGGFSEEVLMNIGDYVGNTGPFDGKLYNIQGYNKVLTPAEVTALYADVTDTPSNLVVNFANNKSATVWTDDVGGETATSQGSVTRTLAKPANDEYPDGDATSKYAEASNITENTVAPGWEDISLTELSVSAESDTGSYSMYISGDAENDRVEYHHTLTVGNSYEVKWKGKVDATSTSDVNCHLWEGLILTATVHMDLVTGWQDYTSGVIVATATAGLFRFYCDEQELWIDDVEIINYGVL